MIAHLYAGHFKEVVMLSLHTHLNSTFAHLTALHHRFNLIELKETEVLRDLEIALRLTEDSSQEPNMTDTLDSTSVTDHEDAKNLKESSGTFTIL